MNVTPYEINLSKTKTWLLKIICPFCVKKVKHGGGNKDEPLGGSRACNNCNAPIRIMIPTPN